KRRTELRAPACEQVIGKHGEVAQGQNEQTEKHQRPCEQEIPRRFVAANMSSHARREDNENGDDGMHADKAYADPVRNDDRCDDTDERKTEHDGEGAMKVRRVFFSVQKRNGEKLHESKRREGEKIETVIRPPYGI